MLMDNFANLNRTTKNIVFSALIIIATIAMYNWILAPHVNYLFATQKYESVVSKAVDKNKRITSEIKVKTKKLKELRQQFITSCGALFTPDEAEEFLSNLQFIAEETGCTVHSLDLVANESPPQKKDTSNNVVANGATLSVIGRYNNIIRLVNKLQNYDKKIWISSFKIEALGSGSTQLKCDMTIIIYTIHDDEAASTMSRPISTAFTALGSEAGRQTPMLRDPTQFGSAETQMGQINISGIVVKGIVYSQDNPAAVIGNQVVYEGDKILGAVVTKINENSVEFEANGKKWTQKVQR